MYRFGNDVGRHGERRRAVRGGQSETTGYLPLWTRAQERSVHVHSATGHRRAGKYVLGNRFLRETVRCIDFDGTGLDLFVGDKSFDSAEVIAVGVREDDCLDRNFGAVLVVQLQRKSGCFRGHQGVTDDQPGITLDDRGVRQVLSDHLVQTIGELEETAALSHQGGLAPQTRVDGVRSVAVGESVSVVREDELPFVTLDQPTVDERRHQTS